MIKTIRIAAILLAVCAVGALVLAVMLGIRPDPDKQKVLAQPGVIEQFKKSAAMPASKPKTSPLLTQAETFKKRIDPPPKPRPVDPNSPGGVVSAKAFVPPPPPPPQFEVVATAYNPQEPGRSFALLNMPGKGFFWVKPGDEVSRATIKQVLSGKLVTSDGREYLVASTPKVNLLKPGSAVPAGYEQNKVPPQASAPISPALAAKMGVQPARPTGPAMAVERSQPAAPVVAAEQPASTSNDLSPEEKKAAADFLREVMKNPEAMGLTKEEAAQLGDLGEILKDTNTTDTGPAAAAQDPNARNKE